MDQVKNKNSKNASKTAEKSDKTASKKDGAGAYVDVLYQRLGDKWFAFSVVDDEIFFAEVPESAIDANQAAAANASGNKAAA